MRVLIAVEFEPERFRRVGDYRVSAMGTLMLPPKFNGTLESALWRGAVRTLCADEAIRTVDCQFGSSPVYRVSRA